jgi:hypothetical protein
MKCIYLVGPLMGAWLHRGPRGHNFHPIYFSGLQEFLDACPMYQKAKRIDKHLRGRAPQGSFTSVG